MSEVRFTEEEQGQVRQPTVPRRLGIAAWLIARGLAKDDRQAEVIMIVVALTAGGIALVALAILNGGGLEATISEMNLRRINEAMLPK